MRKLLLLPLLAAAVALPAGAGHGTGTWERTGTILLPNPATRLYFGVTEFVSPCGGSIDPDVPEGATNGLDGAWFEVPDDAWGHRATLTATEFVVPDPLNLVPGNDVDAWFYDGGCSLIRPSTDQGAYHMATVGSNEFGVVPIGTAWVVVDLVTGGNATFNFRILDYPAA